MVSELLLFDLHLLHLALNHGDDVVEAVVLYERPRVLRPSPGVVLTLAQGDARPRVLRFHALPVVPEMVRRVAFRWLESWNVESRL